MKTCEILMGPIAVGEKNYHAGEKVELSNDDAAQFEKWGYVKILPTEKKEPVEGKPSADKKPPAKEPA